MLTWEGSKISKEIRIYGGITVLKVRPFVRGVMQCYKSYRNGHFKTYCKENAKCKVCEQDFHGRCDKEARCVNCLGGHMTDNRKYEVYQYNLKE